MNRNSTDESKGRVFISLSKSRKVRRDLSDPRSLCRRDGNAFYRLSARANGFQRSTSLFLSNKWSDFMHRFVNKLGSNAD